MTRPRRIGHQMFPAKRRDKHKGSKYNALDQSPDRGSGGFPRLRRGLRRAAAEHRQRLGTSGTGGAAATGGLVPASMPDAKGPAPEVPGAKKGGILTGRPTPRRRPTWTRATSSTRTRPPSSADAPRPDDLRPRATASRCSCPDLATDLGKASADGLTWTFTLKDGIKYEDGTPGQGRGHRLRHQALVRPKDLPRTARPTSASSSRVAPTTRAPTSGDKNWKGVEAPDDKTVVIHLEKSFETLPYFVSFTQFTPIPEAKDKKQTTQLHPLATGPYMFDKYTPGTELELKRNPNWDPATDPARHNYLDGFHFKLGVDTIKTQTAILASNGADATTPQLGPDRLLARPADRGRQEGPVRRGPVLLRVMVNLDTRKIPLAGPQGHRRRVAVRLDPQGRRRDDALVLAPASTIIPPQIPGHLDYRPRLPRRQDERHRATATRRRPRRCWPTPATAEQAVRARSTTTPTTTPIARRSTRSASRRWRRPASRSRHGCRRPRSAASSIGDPKAPTNMLQGPAGWCFDWPSG